MRKVTAVEEPGNNKCVQIKLPDKTWTFGVATQELAHEWAIKLRQWAPKCGGQARRQLGHGVGVSRASSGACGATKGILLRKLSSEAVKAPHNSTGGKGTAASVGKV